MNPPVIGDRVLVRPSVANHPVQRRATTYGQFLSVDWSECVWDDWMQCRLNDGSIQWKPIEETPPSKAAPAPISPSFSSTSSSQE